MHSFGLATSHVDDRQVQSVEDGSLNRVATATFGQAQHVAILISPAQVMPAQDRGDISYCRPSLCVALCNERTWQAPGRRKRPSAAVHAHAWQDSRRLLRSRHFDLEQWCHPTVHHPGALADMQMLIFGLSAKRGKVLDHFGLHPPPSGQAGVDRLRLLKQLPGCLASLIMCCLFESFRCISSTPLSTGTAPQLSVLELQACSNCCTLCQDKNGSLSLSLAQGLGFRL